MKSPPACSKMGSRRQSWCGRTARASCWSRVCTGRKRPRRLARERSSATASTRASTDRTAAFPALLPALPAEIPRKRRFNLMFRDRRTDRTGGRCPQPLHTEIPEKDKGAANGDAPNQDARKGQFGKRSRRSVLATQAAGARPIFAPSRPANEGLVHDLRNRSGGGFGHLKRIIRSCRCRFTTASITRTRWSRRRPPRHDEVLQLAQRF
jgi:hypothetical protein